MSLIDTPIEGAAGIDFFPLLNTPYYCPPPRIYPLGDAPIYELFMKLCPCTEIEFLRFTISVWVSPIPKRRASWRAALITGDKKLTDPLGRRPIPPWWSPASCVAGKVVKDAWFRRALIFFNDSFEGLRLRPPKCCGLTDGLLPSPPLGLYIYEL